MSSQTTKEYSNGQSHTDNSTNNKYNATIQVEVTINYQARGLTGSELQSVTYYVGQSIKFRDGVPVAVGNPTQFKASVFTQARQKVTK